MKRKQSLYVGGYKILRCDQYSNNHYHQTGIQVSSKIHKHAVQRNIIRRAFYAAREDQIDKAIHNHYYKVFIIIHAEHCEIINETIKQKVENRKQTIIREKPQQQLKSHFSSIIISTLGKLKQSISKISSSRQSPSGVNSLLSPNQ